MNERYIEDSLNDIRNIIVCYSDSINYSTYINDLEKILNEIDELMENCNNKEEFQRLTELKGRAYDYIFKAKTLQVQYLESKNEEPEK